MDIEDRKEEVVKLGKEMIRVLDDVLSSEDWSSSLFLKASGDKLKGLRDKAKDICEVGNEVGNAEQKQEELKENKTSALKEGYVRAYVLLYQVDGSNLLGWYRSIKSLCEYTVNRPAYKDEQQVQEFIRSKTSGINSNGYLIVDTKETDLYQLEGKVDQFGHQMFGLKEGAIKAENIVAFVHGNKKRYLVGEKELEFLGEI